MMKKIIILLTIVFIFNASLIFAAASSEQTLSVRTEDISMLEQITDNINFSKVAKPKDPVDMNFLFSQYLYMKYSVNTSVKRKKAITAKLDSDSDVELMLVLSEINATNGNAGSIADKRIKINSSEKLVINDIKDCATGTGKENGLKFQYAINKAYLDKKEDQEPKNINVIFTITEKN
jgi:hypothetical protein